MPSMDNRIRSLIICVGITFLLVTLTIWIYLIRRPDRHSPVPFIESCPRPTKYADHYDFDYTTMSNEYRNDNSSFDYFRLSLSWSPAFCQSRSKQQRDQLFQCQQGFQFIVHGLWPSVRKGHRRSHPRNCRNEKAISLALIKRYFCLMPSEQLMQAEWEKHGTCYWTTAEDYFRQIESLYSRITIPNDIEEILSNSTISKRNKLPTIRERFLQLNPQLKSEDQIDIMMANKGRMLKEVAFCYDRHFTHISC